MGSIPLAANNLRVPEQPNALEQYARLVQLQQQQKLMPGQLQQQQQQIQAGQQENQVRGQQIKDQQSMTAAMQEWDGKDLNQLPGLMFKHGASAQAVMSTKTGIIKQQQDLATLSKDQLANEKTKNDYFVQALDNVKQLPPEQQPQGFQAAVQDAVQKGHLDPQTAQGLQYQGPQQLDVLEKTLMGHNAVLEQALKGADAAKANAQAGEATAQTKKINAEIDPNNPANPDIRKQKYEGILQKVQTGGLSTVSPADLAFARSYENGQRKTTTQSDSLGVTSVNTSGPSGLAAASGGRAAAPAAAGTVAPSKPSGNGVKDSLVDAIGQYKYNPMLLNRIAVKHPEILAAVTQKYPDWSQPNYNAANKAITDLAPSGKTGQQITSYNTFLRHAGALYDAVSSLDNSKYSDLLNKPMNWLAQHTGDPRVADFMAAMQPPMKEFQSFLLNNHAMHEEDVKDAHSLIDVNKTPQEIKAVLNRFAETGSARLSEQNESFKRVTGRDIPNLVSPQAAAAFNKITAKGGAHVIQIGDKKYQYKGSGNTADLNNYTPIQ
jgi:hypothetical protein